MTAAKLELVQGQGQATVTWTESTANISETEFDVGQYEAFVVSTVNASVPTLPRPLVLKHGPLLVTVETWSDGSVVARIPAVGLYADGPSDTLAINELRDEVAAFARSIAGLVKRGGTLAGPLKNQWEAIQALIDVSSVAP